MLVKDVMNKNVVVAKPDASIREASKVMSKFHIGSLVIVEKEKIAGIITGGNILRSLAENNDPDATAVSDVMSKDVVTIEPDKKIEDAVELMIKYKIKKLPVVKDEKLAGIVTCSDIAVVEPKLIEAVASLISMKMSGYQGG